MEQPHPHPGTSMQCWPARYLPLISSKYTLLTEKTKKYKDNMYIYIYQKYSLSHKEMIQQSPFLV